VLRPSPRLLGLIVAAILAVSGCGGGDDTTSEEAGPVPLADAEAASEAAAACLEDAGLDVTVERSEASQTTAPPIYVNLDTVHQVYVAFTTTPEVAAEVAEIGDQLATDAGGTAGSEPITDTIVLIRAAETTDEEVDEVKACIQA
jgi:hypothetical protein